MTENFVKRDRVHEIDLFQSGLLQAHKIDIKKKLNNTLFAFFALRYFEEGDGNEIGDNCLIDNTLFQRGDCQTCLSSSKNISGKKISFRHSK